MMSWRWVDPWGLCHGVIARNNPLTAIMTRDYKTACGIVLTVDDVTKNRRSKGCVTCLWCAGSRRPS